MKAIKQTPTPVVIEMSREEARLIKKIHGLFSNLSLQKHLEADGSSTKLGEDDIRRACEVSEDLFDILDDELD